MKSERFVVVDESVDFRFVEALPKFKLLTHSILVDSPGISDLEVLSIANKQNSLLLTEDKDFGELVIRLGKDHSGIVLIRIGKRLEQNEIDRVCGLISKHYDEMVNNISVITDDRLRIRKLS